MDTSIFISAFIKLFFLLTPFFVLTVFLSLTSEYAPRERARLARRVTLAIAISGSVLFFAGNAIFSVFGITLDAFRIGSGALLFLSAVALVRGREVEARSDTGDISVVPLAIPVTLGPATVGTLLVMGAASTSTAERLTGLAAFLCSSLCVGLMLLSAAAIERLIGRTGLSILSKLTGLVLAALSAQIVFTGVRNFLSL